MSRKDSLLSRVLVVLISCVCVCVCVCVCACVRAWEKGGGLAKDTSTVICTGLVV